MATGIIKTVQNVKNYGFIVPDGGPIGGDANAESKDLFFHRSGVTGDIFDTLTNGQRVGFDVERDPNDTSRHRAVNVTPV